MLCGVCCLVVLLALAIHRRRKRPDHTSGHNLASPSPPTETASRSQSVGHSSGSSESSEVAHIDQWQPHELEAGKAAPVNVDGHRQLGTSSVASSGLSERSIYNTASGTMLFVHD